ncbi:hypothetical protein D3C73_1319610 [compost metagenome]
MEASLYRISELMENFFNFFRGALLGYDLAEPFFPCFFLEGVKLCADLPGAILILSFLCDLLLHSY